MTDAEQTAALTCATTVMEGRREQAIQLHVLEQEAVARVRVGRAQSRPKNTNKQRCKASGIF